MNKQIQTSGSYDGEFYSFNIAFGDGPCMSLDGLSKEDVYEIASCALCLLPEEDYLELTSS